MRFQNREEAGQILAKRIQNLKLRNPLVLALPRGGVPVAFEVAKALQAPLDVLIVRKIGAPTSPEFGIGAITEGQYYSIDQKLVNSSRSTRAEIEGVIFEENRELERRIQTYRKGASLPSLEGRSVIVVDDGLATGVTARVACQYLKKQGANSIILAVPVSSPQMARTFMAHVDAFICLSEPKFFSSVGEFYTDFSQTSDAEVLRLLEKSKSWSNPKPFRGMPSAL